MAQDLARYARAVTQRREAGHHEYTKGTYLMQVGKKDELASIALNKSDGVMIKHVAQGEAKTRFGKASRVVVSLGRGGRRLWQR